MWRSGQYPKAFRCWQLFILFNGFDSGFWEFFSGFKPNKYHFRGLLPAYLKGFWLSLLGPFLFGTFRVRVCWSKHAALLLFRRHPKITHWCLRFEKTTDQHDRLYLCGTSGVFGEFFWRVNILDLEHMTGASTRKQCYFLGLATILVLPKKVSQYLFSEIWWLKCCKPLVIHK